jgi:hypothetical protein
MRFVSTALVMTTIALMLLALMLLGPLAHAKSLGANEPRIDHFVMAITSGIKNKA